MNGTGNRKLKGFFVTIGAIFGVIETAILFSAITLSGDNIVALTSLLAGVSVAFFGANYGEWNAKSKVEK